MISVRFQPEILHAQSKGGISRYLTELVSSFLAAPGLGVVPTRSRWLTSNQHALEADLGWEPPGAQFVHPRIRRALYSFGNAVTDRRERGDLVHATFYGKRGPTHLTAPLITTVYDMAPERLPELFDRNPHQAKRSYVDRSELVICISEFCRSELLALWGPIDARIEVIPLGVNHRTSSPPVIAERDSTVLYVGSRRGYKDFDVLLHAFSQLGTKFDQLIAAGGGPFTSDEQHTIARLKLNTKVFETQPDDQALWELYSRASVFVFPSRYEGFGIPTLEAMGAGCPAVLSNASSHPEVAQDAALYFEAGDADGLRDVLIGLAEDRAMAQELQGRGIERASRFTWDGTARQTALAYQTVLSDGRPPSKAKRRSS